MAYTSLTAATVIGTIWPRLCRDLGPGEKEPGQSRSLNKKLEPSWGPYTTTLGTMVVSYIDVYISTYIHIYLYIYTYPYVHNIYIYIYGVLPAEPLEAPASASWAPQTRRPGGRPRRPPGRSWCRRSSGWASKGASLKGIYGHVRAVLGASLVDFLLVKIVVPSWVLNRIGVIEC